MLLFVASEAFFFLALIISYVYYSHPGGKLSQTASYLDFNRTAIFSVFLFSSSLTIAIAESMYKKGKRKNMLVWLILTVILGLVFLVGQATEYMKLVDLNVTINKNIFGSAFFTLTGFHGLHVLIGLIVLLIIAGLFISGKFSAIEKEAFHSASIYWHFVDIVWVAVFTVVYIGAIL